MPLIDHPDVNAIARCDCGETEFFIGIEFVKSDSSNYIRLIECVSCGRQQRIPFSEAPKPN